MISIRLKNYDRPPNRLICVASKRQIRRAAINMSGAICSGNYYRDKSVRNLLKAYSIGKRRISKNDEPKCFYCESQGEAMLKLEVEHYRPKDGVTVSDLAVGQVHNGYYWLGNEWSNLLLSCKSCNGEDGKGTRFPISNSGNRIFHDQPVSGANILNRRICKLNSARLLPEGPIILNPEYDTPEMHLTFDRTGQIKHVTGSLRGEQTIQILKLFRSPLLVARQKIMNEFVEDIKTYVEARRTNRITSNSRLKVALEPICKKIISRRNKNVAYTLWGNYLNDNFDNLIVAKIPNNYRQILRNAYQYVLLHP
jgi:hypothetical protein